MLLGPDAGGAARFAAAPASFAPGLLHGGSESWRVGQVWYSRRPWAAATTLQAWRATTSDGLAPWLNDDEDAARHCPIIRSTYGHLEVVLLVDDVLSAAAWGVPIPGTAPPPTCQTDGLAPRVHAGTRLGRVGRSR